MSVNDPIKRNEFAPPPADDRDAIIVIAVSCGFFACVIVALVASLFF